MEHAHTHAWSPHLRVSLHIADQALLRRRFAFGDGVCRPGGRSDFTDDSLDGLRPGTQQILETRFGPSLLYGRSVRVDDAIFEHDSPGDRIVLNLFSGAYFEAICTKGGSPYPGLRHWVGRIVGIEKESGVSLVVDAEGMVQGYVIAGNRSFSITPVDKSGWTTVVELTQKRQPDLTSNSFATT